MPGAFIYVNCGTRGPFLRSSPLFVKARGGEIRFTTGGFSAARNSFFTCGSTLGLASSTFFVFFVLAVMSALNSFSNFLKIICFTPFYWRYIPGNVPAHLRRECVGKSGRRTLPRQFSPLRLAGCRGI